MRTKPWVVASVFFVWVLLEARPAYAYLDPGAGGALVAVLVSVLAAVGYAVRSVVYWFTGKSKAPAARKRRSSHIKSEDHDALVLFSEGGDYWLTFKPVVEALLARGRPFRYISMDAADPGLDIDDGLMESRFIGDGAMAHARVTATRARVMLSTTPHLGVPGYPIGKPSRVECLAHVLHGCYDLAFYRKHSLDYYDAVITLAPFMERTIRHLEKIRGLPAKELYPGGTPNLDEIGKHVVKRTRAAGDRPVVLLAPTWSQSSFLRLNNLDFIGELSSSGEYEVILRPHPQSWRKEANFLESVISRFSGLPHFRVDKSLNPGESMNAADLLIAERSAVRLEFAFLHERPVITVATPREHLDELEASDLEWIWQEEAERKIGLVVSGDEAGDMKGLVKRALAITPESLAAYRDEHVWHIGRSGEVVADWLIEKCKDPAKEVPYARPEPAAAAAN